MTTTVEPILTTRNLVKRYGRVTALDHCDFDLYPNEILAVIGDNGAGKSTTLAAMIDRRSESMSGHILTIEDPIEFQFHNKNYHQD